MFGCVVAGRLVQSNLQQVDETHAFFELPAASTINHVCVFLLGTVPFPDGYGATVHFFWPGKGFQLLGMLSNDKPSAIFRLRGTFTSPSTPTHSMFTSAEAPVPSTEVTAILGIAIEPLQSIVQQMSTLSSSVTKVNTNPLSDPTVLAERIVKHLFRYLSGFTSDGMGLSVDTMVPLSLITKWYESFIGKVKNRGVIFLENED